jgi:two-component system, OmpR family, alkaline phosphatase synthesis response regulator PhoP
MSNDSILIVDDEPYLTTALTYILSKEGYQVSTACDGEDALQRITENKPLIMFLDIMMPKKNGYEVCEIIKKTPGLKDIYIIMLSAKGWEADKEKALSVGADEFMSKPYSPKEVIARLKKAMEYLLAKSGTPVCSD